MVASLTTFLPTVDTVDIDFTNILREFRGPVFGIEVDLMFITAKSGMCFK